MEAAPASLTFLMISAMTDLAELMRDEPELIHAKVRHLCVMGGLQKSGADQWEPDTAVNNNWDPAAAKLMYDFCFGRGIPMSVVSRNAVPNLPMQLAKDFAAREPKNVIMEYLVNAQELGLCGLWKTLCAGRLPERCSKQWYFETFCGVDAETFAAKRAFYEGLGPDAEISPYLNGHVKPYDVCALIFALPDAASAFDLRPRLEEAKGTTHRFYLEPSAMISLEKITKLLSETFLEVCEGFSGLEAASWSADRYQPASSTTSTGTSASSGVMKRIETTPKSEARYARIALRMSSVLSERPLQMKMRTTQMVWTMPQPSTRSEPTAMPICGMPSAIMMASVRPIGNMCLLRIGCVFAQQAAMPPAIRALARRIRTGRQSRSADRVSRCE